MKRFVQPTERALMGAGIVLLALVAAAALHRAVMSRASLRAFDLAVAAAEAPSTAAHEPAGESEQVAATAPASCEDVDFSLWSPKRVEKYRASLEVKVETPLAVLEIPKISLLVPVLAGTDEFALNRGVGHISGTAVPGTPGNVGIAGHRDGFFRGLKDIEVGDRLDLKTLDGRASFQVEAVTIVPPSDVSVLDPTDRPTLTLVTCYPFYFVGDAPLRYIVRAGLVEPEQ